MIFRQRGVAVDPGDVFEQRTGKGILAVAGPIGEWRDHAGQPAVAVGLDQLALLQRNASFAPLDRPVTQHDVREIDVELVRRHVGTLRHEAHVAERASVGDLPVVGRRDRVELAACRIVDQIEQPREGIAQIEASPTGVTDVEDAVHLGFGFLPVGEVRIFPRDAMPGGGFQTALSHRCSLLLAKRAQKLGSSAPILSSAVPDQSASRAFWKRPA